MVWDHSSKILVLNRSTESETLLFCNKQQMLLSFHLADVTIWNLVCFVELLWVFSYHYLELISWQTLKLFGGKKGRKKEI